MLEHAHYVAVMRTKPAELNALDALDPTLRPHITPLLECPERTLKHCESARDCEAKFEEIAGHLTGWSGRSIFLDFDRLRSTTGPHPIELMAASIARLGIRPVMVVSLKTGAESIYTQSIRHILERHGSGISLRISPAELQCDSLDQLIDPCLKRYGVSPAQAHLVIDRGRVDGSSVTYPEFADRIPYVDSWRTLTVLAGSFPPDLSELARGRQHRLRRFEWRQWRALESWSGRRPAFGDFAIQHVYFKEPVAVPNVSASVRYTIDEDFLVLRGEGINNAGGPGAGQWNGWASILIEMPEFCGGMFSTGDQYIVERATDWSRSGNAPSWLEAGFSHHLTTAALQVIGDFEQVRRVTATNVRWPAVVNVDLPPAIW